MYKKGFTLLEILVVIIIIGILATLALPQYMKTTKKARAGEAVSNIGSLRGALLRYYQEHDKFPEGSSDDEKISQLDIENPATRPGSYFDYSFSGTSPDDLVITATGKANTIMKGVTVKYEASTGRVTTTGLE